MSSPKEKAESLIDEMSKQTYSYQPYAGAHYNEDEIGWEAGKKCALIAVDEILRTMIEDYEWDEQHNGNIIYWKEVKQEIEKL